MKTVTLVCALLLSAGIAAAKHVMLTPDDVQFGPFPAGGPGNQIAVVAGDPGKAGPFVIRIKSAPGTIVPPHWHPADENVTVVKGTIEFGLGKKFDDAALHAMPAGSYMLMPKGQPHFARARDETIVQVHGMGPFKVIYVNPADDPLRKKTHP
jgi:quercetin dioxygenase-like cupin family protein